MAAGDQFDLDVLIAASAVRGVGCGTGALLCHAREAGNTARSCGLDPVGGMRERVPIGSPNGARPGPGR